MSRNIIPYEYVGWGGGLYIEPDLKISFPDGNRDLVLQYASHEVQGDTLSNTLTCLVKSM